jgi:UDP-N-acetylmuramoylalanine--D-glutamate ligase
MKKVLVLGFGVSGKAAAALLRSRGIVVVAADKNPAPDMFVDSADFPLDDITQVVLSPGVSPTHPIVERALARQIEVIGEIESAFRLLKNRCIGVTGTNGKTTVTKLVEHVLNASGIPARAVGNVGTALSHYLLNPNAAEVLVIELSSFQLETLETKKLLYSIYLNITPDHLDRYGSMREYAAAKARIQRCSEQLFVSRQVAAEYGDLFKPGIEIFGDHNIEAAEVLCKKLGVGEQLFSEALKSFQKPSHRIELIGEVKGVQYINDSKGTNIDAVMYAVQSIDRPILLIIGGIDKGASYCPWIEKFQGRVKKIIAYGQAAFKMELELASFFPFQGVEKFESAFAVASSEAILGDCVLLSPGCSSYDQFRNAEHRGDEFKNRVQSLQQEFSE